MGRQKHSTDFKKKVALEAIREQKNINQIAKEFQVHPVQVSKWKKQLLEGCGIVFDGDNRQEPREADLTYLQQLPLFGVLFFLFAISVSISLWD